MTNDETVPEIIPDVLPPVSEDATEQVNKLYEDACKLVGECLKVLTALIEEEQQNRQKPH